MVLKAKDHTGNVWQSQSAGAQRACLSDGIVLQQNVGGVGADESPRRKHPTLHRHW